MLDMAKYLSNILGAAALGAALLGASAPSTKAEMDVESIPYCRLPNTTTLEMAVTNSQGEAKHLWYRGIAPLGTYQIEQIEIKSHTVDGKTGQIKDSETGLLPREKVHPFFAELLDDMLKSDQDNFKERKPECGPTS